MPGIILKLDRDTDAYAVFSTVVDGFTTDVMTRGQMFEYLKRQDPRPEELIEARLVRADLTGTSMKDGTNAAPVLTRMLGHMIWESK